MHWSVLISLVVFSLVKCGQGQVLEGRHILTERPLGRFTHHWPGKFKPARLCPVGERVVGFRAQVQKPESKEKVGLTGVEMKCSDGSVIGPDGIVDSGVGKWTDWRVCATGSFVVGFNVRYEDVERYHRNRDYHGVTYIKMVCSDGEHLEHDGYEEKLENNGFNKGKWDKQSSCSATSHLCGYAAEVQDYQGDKDDTGVNRIKFLCCTKSQVGQMPALPDLTRLGKDICIGSQQEKYGIIKMPVAGFLHSLRFEYVDGEIGCTSDPRRATNFGCEVHHLRDSFSIFATTSDDSVIFPTNDNNQFKGDRLFYEVIGKSGRDAKEFSLTSSEPTFFAKGDELRIWYGEDLWNRHDWDNGNHEVCVDVYGKILN